jgi:serine/threonine-protein kinase
VYSASVVLWEALTGQRLFKADDVPSLVYSIINDEIRAPSSVNPGVPRALDLIVMKGLDREASNRWASARELAEALERVMTPAPAREIGPWVVATAGDALAWRQELVDRIESETSMSLPPPDGRHSPAGGIETSGVVSADGSTQGHGQARADGDADDDDDDPEDERATLTNEATASDGERGGAYGAYGAPGAYGAAGELDPARGPETSLYDPAEGAARSRASLAAMVAAGVLLVSGAVLFGLRWMQLQAEEDAAPPPATSSEQAITIGSGQRTSVFVPLPGSSGTATAPTTTPPPVTDGSGSGGAGAGAGAAGAAGAAGGAAGAAGGAAGAAAGQPATEGTRRAGSAATRERERPRGASTPTSQPDECENPFTVDSRGIRHPKPQCFKR